MSDNKPDKIMADLINEANTLSAARTVFISLNKNIDLINQQQTGYSTFFCCCNNDLPAVSVPLHRKDI